MLQINGSEEEEEMTAEGLDNLFLKHARLTMGFGKGNGSGWSKSTKLATGNCSFVKRVCGKILKKNLRKVSHF